MPPFLLPFAILFSFFKELWDLFKTPKYRALLYWIVVVLLTGMVFYSWVEGWSLLDSLYFSVITLTTVGYGDLAPSQPISKVFTIIYIFFGLSILATFLKLLAKEREEIHLRRFGSSGKQDDAAREGK